MLDAGRFLGAFIRNPTRIGAVAPSSTVLARAMVRELSIAAGESVLEYGPGTGPFTAQIASMMGRDGRGYLGIEREPSFVALLTHRFPSMRFVAGSAEDAHRLHAESGLGPVRAIISGLPFASLPAAVQDGVIAGLDALMADGCVFRTFQYVHAYPLPSAVRFRRRMTELLGACRRSRAVLRNLPPAYVLTWQRG